MSDTDLLIALIASLAFNAQHGISMFRRMRAARRAAMALPAARVHRIGPAECPRDVPAELGPGGQSADEARQYGYIRPPPTAMPGPGQRRLG